MSAQQPFDVVAQESSWFSSTNAISRIMGFSFIANILHGLINGQGAVFGTPGPREIGAGSGRGPNSNVIDTLRLFFLGWIIEGGRRFFAWITGGFKPFQYSITAQFTEGDPAYEWIVLLLTEEQIWTRSRHFRVNATSSMRRWSVKLESKKQKKDNNSEEHAEYVPTYDQPQLFKWKGYWVEVYQSLTTDESHYSPGLMQVRKRLYLTIYTRDMGALSAMVEEAREQYLETSRPHVIVHTADQPSYGPESPWIGVKRKTRRPLNSIVLQEGVLDSLVEDAREFIKTEEWYNHAGIPHRRGYLLYGPPGTGKSSTIYAIAGELGLEIYSLSLASSYVDDAFLARAVASIPKQAIFLIEDIDCAFPSREDLEDDEAMGLAGSIGYMASMVGMPGHPAGPRSAVTLSGLLNVLDGVGSEEGKIFFATTNYVDRLDPALVRPGRIDKKIQYKLATRAQAAALFLRFYPEAFTSLRSERSLTVGKSTKLTLSEKQAVLRSLSDQFAASVPEYEFSTAELQGFLLSCKQDPEGAVEQIAKWVEDETNEKALRTKREADKKARAKQRKEAMEAKFWKGGLASLGVDIGDASGGNPSPERVAAPELPGPGPIVSRPISPAINASDIPPQPFNTASNSVVSLEMSPAPTTSEGVAVVPPLPVTKPLVNGNT